MKNSTAQNLESIQALRGIAALMVVVRHCIENTFTAPALWLSRLHELGAAGVDIFFVISGFIMFYTARGQRPAMFLKNRAVRILPLYWAVTATILLALLLKPSLFGQLRLQWGHALCSFLLLPAYNSAGLLYPLLIPGWTLVYEFFFYAIFALVLWWSPRRPLTGIALGLLLAVLGARGLPWLPEAARATYGNPLVFEFLAGCLIGALATRHWRPAAGLRVAVLVLGIAGFLATVVWGRPAWLRLFYYGLPAAAVVFHAVFAELGPRDATAQYSMPGRLLLRMGDASYSLYVIHVPLIALMVKVLHRLPPGLTLLLCFIVSVVAGWLCYRLFEQPVTRGLKRQTASWFAAGAPAAARHPGAVTAR